MFRITLMEVIHLLQVQEQHRLMREDDVVEDTLLHIGKYTFEVKNNKRNI